jgi:hypothetical protein
LVKYEKRPNPILFFIVPSLAPVGWLATDKSCLLAHSCC